MKKSEEAIFESALKDTELIGLLKAKEVELRKESAECTEKIKEHLLNNKVPLSGSIEYIDLHKQRIHIDNAIYHTVGLLQFLTKNK